ncbi:MAG: TlyA family RNA methyltransferase [Bacillota bacterium]
MKKIRLDVLLVEKNIFPSREQARRAIMAGEILVDNMRVDKPGTIVACDSQVTFMGKTMPYVSRGGYKLKKAIENFKLNLLDKVVIDIGASTGGFTDCVLKYGAQKVYAVDVGYGQLAWSLRNHPKVVVMERTNARELTVSMFPDKADLITVDVSFISVNIILSILYPLLKPLGQIVILVKPQFEAGRHLVGKKGVVKDPTVHINVIKSIINEAFKQGFVAKKLDYSPITGPEGNIEFLLLLELTGDISVNEDMIKSVVEDSKRLLKK